MALGKNKFFLKSTNRKVDFQNVKKLLFDRHITNIYFLRLLGTYLILVQQTIVGQDSLEPSTHGIAQDHKVLLWCISHPHSLDDSYQLRDGDPLELLRLQLLFHVGSVVLYWIEIWRVVMQSKMLNSSFISFNLFMTSLLVWHGAASCR
jgi:hypothetical protein